MTVKQLKETWSHATLMPSWSSFFYCHKFITEYFVFSKFIYVNYNATFDFTKKESAYIAGSVYMVSMLFGPVMGLVVVSHTEHMYYSTT